MDIYQFKMKGKRHKKGPGSCKENISCKFKVLSQRASFFFNLIFVGWKDSELSRSTIGLVFISSNDYFVIEHCVYNVKSHVFAHSNNQSVAMTTGHLDQKKSFEAQKKRAVSANRALIIKLI